MKVPGLGHTINESIPCSHRGSSSGFNGTAKNDEFLVASEDLLSVVARRILNG